MEEEYQSSLGVGKMKKTVLKLTAMVIIVVLMGSGSVWASLTDGSVAHWKLDGNATDSAGGHDGTLSGNPQWTESVRGGALCFGTFANRRSG